MRSLRRNMSKYDFLHEKGWQGLAKKRLDLSDPETLIGAVKIRASLMTQAPIRIRRDPHFFLKYGGELPSILSYAKCTFTFDQHKQLIKANPRVIPLLDYSDLGDDERFALVKYPMLCYEPGEIPSNARFLTMLSKNHYQQLFANHLDYINYWLYADLEELVKHPELVLQAVELIDKELAESLLIDSMTLEPRWPLALYKAFLDKLQDCYDHFPHEVRMQWDIAKRAALYVPGTVRHWPSEFYTKEKLRDVIIKAPFAYYYLPEGERDLEITLLAYASCSVTIKPMIPKALKSDPYIKEYLEEAKDFGAVP